MAVWYVNYGDGSTTGYYAITRWATGTVKTVGQVVRQLAVPAVNNEKCFVCIVAGTTHATTEPTWNLAQGAKTTDNTITWMECTGQSGVNGDAVNTPGWTVGLGTVVLGKLIHGTSNHVASLFICTTAGTVGAVEPTWPGTLGTTMADGTAVWTRLGLVSDFSAFSNPHARLANALAVRSAGDTQFVADNHAETQAAAMTLTVSPAPSMTLCVNHANAPPTDLATTATISTTGANNLTIVGNGYIYGITFNAGSAASVSALTIQNANAEINFEACNFILLNTAPTSSIALGAVAFNQSGIITWNNCSVKFANAAQSLSLRFGTLNWRNSIALLAGGTIPTNFITLTGMGGITITGVDLSAITSNIVAGGNSGAFVSIANSIINAAANISGALTASNGRTYVQQVDSGANLPRHEFYWFNGIQTTDKIVVRSGGASDGTTPISRKVITNANGDWSRPFAGYPIIVFSNRVNLPLTVTIEIINDGVTLTNKNVWLEVEYFGDAASPLASLASNGLVNGLSTPVSLPISSASWTTTGITTPIKQQLAVTFTPVAPGMIRATIKTNNNTTLWIDPKITMS